MEKPSMVISTLFHEFILLEMHLITDKSGEFWILAKDLRENADPTPVSCGYGFVNVLVDPKHGFEQVSIDVKETAIEKELVNKLKARAKLMVEKMLWTM